MFYVKAITVYRAPSIIRSIEDITRAVRRNTVVYTGWQNVTRRMYARSESDVNVLRQRFRGEVTDPRSIPIQLLFVFITGTDKDQMQVVAEYFENLKDEYGAVRQLDQELALLNFAVDTLTSTPSSDADIGLSVGMATTFLTERLGQRMTLESLRDRRIPTLEELFQSAPRDPLTPVTFGESINTARVNRRNAQFVTRAQQRSGQQRLEERRANEWRIEWNNTHFWVAPDPDGNPVAWPLDQLTDEHLWKTVCWMVQNYVQLYQQYDGRTPSDVPVGLTAGNWMGRQPIFRALVVAAIDRKLTFPNTVFSFIRSRLSVRLDQIDTPQEAARPWADPRQQNQWAGIADLAEMEITPEPQVNAKAEYGRDFRQLDITDDDESGDAV